MQQSKNLYLSLAISLVSIFIVSGCQQKTEKSAQYELTQDSNTSVTNSADAPNTSAQRKNINIINTTYHCDEGKVIYATYDNNNINSPKASLMIDGRQFEMYSVIAASGALYATEQGINPEQGMRWHTKGLEATLETMTLDDSADPSMEKLLLRCQEPI